MDLYYADSFHDVLLVDTCQGETAIYVTAQ